MSRWSPPPNWPAPKAGWSPPAGWQPLPEWGPAPPDWNFWPDGPAPDKQDAPHLTARASASVQRAKEALAARQARAHAATSRTPAANGAQKAPQGGASAQTQQPSSGAVGSAVLFQGVSHDPGRNARVTLYSDRLERVKDAKMMAMSRAKQDTEVTPVRSISSVQATKDGLLYTKVTAYASGNNIEFRFGHEEAQRFKDVLLQLVLGGSSQHPPPPAAAAPDVMGQLRQLADMRDAGTVSEQEFAAKKADLLRRL